MVACICAHYEPLTVATAAFMAAGVTIALTVYAITTKTDFTILRGSFFVIGSAFFLCTIVILFLPNNGFWKVMLSGLGVILYGFYLIIDT